jgi:hypothetical protein
LGSGSVPICIRWPIGSSPSKYCRAIDSLITTTGGAPATSRGSISRPRRNGTPSAGR